MIYKITAQKLNFRFKLTTTAFFGAVFKFVFLPPDESDINVLLALFWSLPVPEGNI